MQLNLNFILFVVFDWTWFEEKKEEIWLSPVTKTPTPTEQSIKQRDNIKTPPKIWLHNYCGPTWDGQLE